MQNKRLFFIFLLVFFIAGCAHSPDPGKADGGQDALRKRGIFLPSDVDVVREALLMLETREGEPDYDGAKAGLATIVSKFPLSKWAESAQALVLTIDHLLALQEKVKTTSAALLSEKAEKEKLINDCASVKERDRAEINRLQQENEQLKNDIALLKKLEIQLDKRGKLLK
jgi:hypothetical protein